MMNDGFTFRPGYYASNCWYSKSNRSFNQTDGPGIYGNEIYQHEKRINDVINHKRYTHQQSFREDIGKF